MTTITIELCQEDRARLDAILDALQTSGTPFSAPAEEAPAPKEEPKTEELPDQAALFDVPTEEKPSVTHADIQRKVVELSAAGKKAEVRDIVTAYARKVSDIPAGKLPEVLDKLTALEG